MPRIVHFEIPARDPDSLADFYRRVFGWKIDKWEGPVDYWLVTTGDQGPGIDGALLRTNPVHQGTVNVIDVESVSDFTQNVEAAGGEVVTPRTPIPGLGYVAYCRDTAGNVFGLFQNDESAA